mmetsp:Transcript_42361/g.90115  ORF Transcript_42361/g.90115 Transcript_42361/m.90115 type:complete len:329 (-) Transcript_42361:101-1087(-)
MFPHALLLFLLLHLSLLRILFLLICRFRLFFCNASSGIHPLHQGQHVPHQMQQHRIFFRAPTGDESDPELLAHRYLRVQPYHRRVVHHPRLRELHERPGHRRREQHRLPVLGHGAAYLSQLHRESHLEEAVGLVENNTLALPQVEVGDFAQVVRQTPGRSDDHVGAGAQQGELLLHRFSPVDAHEVEAVILYAVMAERAEDLKGLEGELAGGGEDYGEGGLGLRAGGDVAALAAGRHEAFQQWSQKRHRLSAPGASHDAGVRGCQEYRERLSLHGRGGSITKPFDAREDGRGEVERLEAPSIAAAAVIRFCLWVGGCHDDGDFTSICL